MTGAPVEVRAVEVRAGDGDGLTVEGVAVRYGDMARVMVRGRAMMERFEPGAFAGRGMDGVTLTRGHERARVLARAPGTLALTDSAEALAFRADMPETTEARDAMTLVRAQVLTGASVEFVTLAETVGPKGERVIQRAVLARISLVDTGAYRGSGVEAREEPDGEPLGVPLWAL